MDTSGRYSYDQRLQAYSSLFEMGVKGQLRGMIPWSTSMASASRVNAPTTVNARSRRPSNSASETKSIDHISFAAEAAGCRTRLAALTMSKKADFEVGYVNQRIYRTSDMLVNHAVPIITSCRFRTRFWSPAFKNTGGQANVR